MIRIMVPWVLSTLVFALPLAGAAQAVDPGRASNPRIACGTTFAVIATNDPNTVVVRITDPAAPIAGTVKAYGTDRVWSGAVTASATTVAYDVLPRPDIRVQGSGTREESFLVRADGPIEAIEFAPSWTSCVFRGGVRAPTNSDPFAASRPIVAVTDPAPIEPARCARPYGAAAVIRAANMEMPLIARQQGISGTVRVAVALDERGIPTFAQVVSAPSAVLKSPALYAARSSVYLGAIFRCVPVPSGYEFAATFL
jgi:TonB-like protein